MTAEQQHLYFSRREDEARAAAGRATDTCARDAHLRMASAYNKLAGPRPLMAVPRAPTQALPIGKALFARSIEKGVAVVPPPLTPRVSH